MVVSAQSPADVEELRRWVERTICTRQQLERGAFRFTHRLLVQAGNPCGMSFCLHGPRQVKLTAIWETASNSVIFYDSSGQRQSRVWLPVFIPLDG